MKRVYFTLSVLLVVLGLNGCMTLGGFSRSMDSDLYVLTGMKPLGKGVVQICRADGSCTVFARADHMMGQRLYQIQALPGDEGVLVASGSYLDAGRVWHCTQSGCVQLAGIEGLAGFGGRLVGHGNLSQLPLSPLPWGQEKQAALERVKREQAAQKREQAALRIGPIRGIMLGSN